MILPLLLIGVLPKMMNAADPDAQKVYIVILLVFICCANLIGLVISSETTGQLDFYENMDDSKKYLG